MRMEQKLIKVGKREAAGRKSKPTLLKVRGRKIADRMEWLEEANQFGQDKYGRDEWAEEREHDDRRIRIEKDHRRMQQEPDKFG